MPSSLLVAVDKLASAPSPAPWVVDAAARLQDLPPALIDRAEVEAAVRPYRWLLERVGADGLALTSAGYLRPDDVKAVMTELGWDQHWIGTMNRENQTLPARQLRESAMALRLVRQHKGRLVLAPAGRTVGQDPMLLWRHIARSLPVDRREVDAIASAARLLWAACVGPATRPESDAAVAEAVGALFILGDGSRPTAHGMWLTGRGSSDVLRVLAGQDPNPAPALIPALAVTAFREALHPEPGSASAHTSRPASGPRSTRRRASASSPAGPAEPAQAGVACLTIKATLRDVSPPVWRRVRVPKSMPLTDLAIVLITAMGWTGTHLWGFRKDRVNWVVPSPDWPNEDRDARRAKVGSVLRVVGDRAIFEYDFGDGWEHDLVVESIESGDPGVLLLAGRRSCPPEDVGGPWGYAEFLEAIGDPDNPEHAARLMWVGGSFDPDRFDLEELRESVRTALVQGPLFDDW